MDLSILICSTNTRYKTFGVKIQDQVWSQYDNLSPADQDRIEILMLTDNKKMMLGEKRNVMVEMAQGDYIQFIDDDDRIEPDMFKTLLDAIETSHADVITFLASVSINGGKPKICRYSKAYKTDVDTATEYHRLPNHISCVRRKLALKASFPNVLYGEDSAYSKLLRPLLKKEYAIDRVLYHYDYNSATTETQIELPARVRVHSNEAIADVVILSNSKSSSIRQMTQATIDSCIKGAGELKINIICIEQQAVKFENANTVYKPGKFSYNGFANFGAGLGDAEWLMVANNDLLFQTDWLRHLLAANYPVVSPINPGDTRQQGILNNTRGSVNGQHFSGWCFMLKRSLWEQIGGFDECVDFWCSDDVTIQQLLQIGVEPMLVPASQVRHLGSATLNSVIKTDDLTWKQVHIFNQKYNQAKFDNHPMYKRWKLRNGVS